MGKELCVQHVRCVTGKGTVYRPHVKSKLTQAEPLVQFHHEPQQTFKGSPGDSGLQKMHFVPFYGAP